jgi:hypothetical protein
MLVFWCLGSQTPQYLRSLLALGAKITIFAMFFAAKTLAFTQFSAYCKKHLFHAKSTNNSVNCNVFAFGMHPKNSKNQPNSVQHGPSRPYFYPCLADSWPLKNVKMPPEWCKHVHLRCLAGVQCQNWPRVHHGKLLPTAPPRLLKPAADSSGCVSSLLVLAFWLLAFLLLALTFLFLNS